MQDLNTIVRMNLIRNNKVTREDINLSKKVHSLDIDLIKSKATC